VKAADEHGQIDLGLEQHLAVLAGEGLRALRRIIVQSLERRQRALGSLRGGQRRPGRPRRMRGAHRRLGLFCARGGRPADERPVVGVIDGNGAGSRVLLAVDQ
jgi:hypothetical protein